MDVQAAFESLRRGWYYIVLTAVGAAMVGGLLSFSQAPVFETTASYIVSPTRSNADAAAEAVRTLDDARSRAIMTTFAEVLGSSTTVTDAVATLGLDEGILDEYELRAVVVPEANVTDLIVNGPNARLSVVLASAVGEIGARRFVDLYDIYDVGILDPAVAASSPTNRGPAETAVVAAALGILIGAVIALIMNAPRVRRNRAMRLRISQYGDGTVTPINEDGERYLRVTAG